MKIQIVKASNPSHWYADRIGEFFEVISGPDSDNDYVVYDADQGGNFYLSADDCNIINKEEFVMVKSLKEIVIQLRSCGYTCEAGPLVNNVDFQLLEEIAGVEVVRTLGDRIIDDSREEAAE